MRMNYEYKVCSSPRQRGRLLVRGVSSTNMDQSHRPRVCQHGELELSFGEVLSEVCMMHMQVMLFSMSFT